MPKPNVAIPAPQREALIECFPSITRLVRPELRHQLVLVRSAASIAHSSEGATAGALNFSIESDGKIAFDAPQGFRARVNIIELGNGCIERIHVAEPFHDGSVASMSDLLLLRAVTVADRGGDGDIADFKWLLAGVARRGQFPAIDDEELAVLVRAGESCLGELGRLVIAAILGKNNEAAALGLLGY
ncbi:hypothetical protein B0T26DRAFT_769836 [Lasiosphaeria miniovina]|uniref:Uncharacterized protein n=1 Tax=Lasiosphaeria miniovina TaxID=1954250 RepID=A0AA40ATU3_9PEZI|nr:uncharacterized protein B0T26DRAFT_769836 [Lasiosphaeria miniovina]KAK0721906.1 hypothetical protein B0T26DRAFT_769836 [Lasiosphaeria miniovina]